jgi:hypothetical protein
MRMNTERGETAAELIGRLEEAELADLIYAFGEERLSRRIARKIKQHLAESGPFSGTAALAYLVAGCYPPPARRGRIHPATRTFQALRIAVNDELGVLDRLLLQAPDWLESGGLLAVISFHSLEDRRVKTAFVSDDRLQRVTRKPMVAGDAEAEANPRSRSAKLRVAQRREGLSTGTGGHRQWSPGIRPRGVDQGRAVLSPSRSSGPKIWRKAATLMQPITGARAIARAEALAPLINTITPPTSPQRPNTCHHWHCTALMPLRTTAKGLAFFSRQRGLIKV